MKFLALIFVSYLWISVTIAQGEKGANTNTDDADNWQFGGVVDKSPGSDPGDQGSDEDAVILPPSADVGIEERRISGAIPRIMGLRDGTTVNRDQFTNWLISNRISDAQINELLSLTSTAEMFQFFFFNNKLKKYHNMAANKYGERFADRPIELKWDDDNLTAFDNELHIKSNLRNIKRHITPIKDYIKILKINFIQLDDDLQAALNYIHTTLGNKLENLEICGGEEHDFQPFKKFTFPAVKVFTVFGSNLPSMNYKKIFPSVESLALIRTSLTTKNFVPNNFPRLKRLQVEIGKSYFKKADVLQALESNSKITDVGTIYGDPDLHNQINQKYPNIVNMAVINPSQKFKSLKKPVKMNHVQRFLFAHETSCRQAKFFRFSQLSALYWHCVRSPKTLFGDIMKNNSKQIEIINVEDAILTNKDLQEMVELEKLGRVSIGFNADASIQMTGNGLANLAKNSKTLAGLRLKRAQIEFVKEVYAAFNANGLANWIVKPLNFLDAVSHVYFKNPNKTVQWNDEIKFLLTTTFLGQ